MHIFHLTNGDIKKLGVKEYCTGSYRGHEHECMNWLIEKEFVKEKIGYYYDSFQKYSFSIRGL